MLHSNKNHTGSKEEHATVAGILLVVGLGHVQVVRPKVLELSPQDLVKVLQRLSIPALLDTSLREVIGCSTVNAAAACAGVTHSGFCCCHAKRAHEASLACWTLIMGVCAVSVRLHKTSYVNVACRAPTRASA